MAGSTSLEPLSSKSLYPNLETFSSNLEVKEERETIPPLSTLEKAIVVSLRIFTLGMFFFGYLLYYENKLEKALDKGEIKEAISAIRRVGLFLGLERFIELIDTKKDESLKFVFSHMDQMSPKYRSYFKARLIDIVVEHGVIKNQSGRTLLHERIFLVEEKKRCDRFIAKRYSLGSYIKMLEVFLQYYRNYSPESGNDKWSIEEIWDRLVTGAAHSKEVLLPPQIAQIFVNQGLPVDKIKTYLDEKIPHIVQGKCPPFYGVQGWIRHNFGRLLEYQKFCPVKLQVIKSLKGILNETEAISEK